MNDYGPWSVAKPCWVEREGSWYEGRLTMWDPAARHPSCGAEGLAGSVRYRVGPGLQHFEWVHQERIRPRGEGHPDPNPADQDEVAQPW